MKHITTLYLNRKMTDNGLRISQEEVDVKAGSDLEMVVTSKYPLLKGSLSGSVTQAVYPPQAIWKTFTVNTSTDVITTSSAHSLSIGDRVDLSTDDTLPSPLSEYLSYYVISVPTSTTLKVSLAPGGTSVNITDTGTGPHYLAKCSIITIAHGLDYIPIIVAYFHNSGDDIWWYIPFGADSSFGRLYINAYADDENGYIKIDYRNDLDPSANNYICKYYIYLDKAKL